LIQSGEISQMPKSRGRKPPKNKLPQQPPKKSNQEQIQSSILRRIVDNPIALGVGLIAGLFAIYDATLSPPEISAKGDQDTSYPFALPFEVRNNSWFFPMRASQLHCGIDDVIAKEGVRFSSFSVLSGSAATIEPKNEAAFRCVLLGRPGQKNMFAIPQSELLKAHIFLSISYKTLWFPRMSHETEFTWYAAAKPPRWVKGPIVD
jgi:hypothetical protein